MLSGLEVLQQMGAKTFAFPAKDREWPSVNIPDTLDLQIRNEQQERCAELLASAEQIPDPDRQILMQDLSDQASQPTHPPTCKCLACLAYEQEQLEAEGNITGASVVNLANNLLNQLLADITIPELDADSKPATPDTNSTKCDPLMISANNLKEDSNEEGYTQEYAASNDSHKYEENSGKHQPVEARVP